MAPVLARAGWRRRRHRLRGVRGPAATMALAASLLGAALGPAAPAVAQVVATAGPSVVVSGVGRTSAPAAAATVQLLLGLGDRQFGFSSDATSSGGFESASASESSEEVSADGRRRDRAPRPKSISPEQADAVAVAVAKAANIDRGAIQVTPSPLAAGQGEGRGRNVRLDLVVSDPTPRGLSDLLAATSDAAAEQGLVVEVAGVRYDPADCATIEEAAEKAAVADARARAERLARLLGVTLGGVATASSNVFDAYAGLYQPEVEPGCDGQVGSSYDSRQGGLGLTVPVFDPTRPAEITVATTLTIAYAIEGG